MAKFILADNAPVIEEHEIWHRIMELVGEDFRPSNPEVFRSGHLLEMLKTSTFSVYEVINNNSLEAYIPEEIKELLNANEARYLKKQKEFLEDSIKSLEAEEVVKLREEAKALKEREEKKREMLEKLDNSINRAKNGVFKRYHYGKAANSN
jgi:uncharacterized protein (UPF0305 family)